MTSPTTIDEVVENFTHKLEKITFDNTEFERRFWNPEILKTKEESDDSGRNAKTEC